MHAGGFEGFALSVAEFRNRGDTGTRNLSNRVDLQGKRLMERGDLTAVVTDTDDFDGAAQAHRDVPAGGSVDKLVITPCFRC